MLFAKKNRNFAKYEYENRQNDDLSSNLAAMLTASNKVNFLGVEEKNSDTLLAILAICIKKRESEGPIKRKKRPWMKNTYHNKRNEYTYKDLIKEMKMVPKNDFRHFFVSDGDLYAELLHLVGPLIKKKDTLMRDAIPVGVRLSTTLRFLATGNHFENLKSSSLMSPSAISKIVFETCEAIIACLKNYIKLPETHEWKASVSDFHERLEFPNCLGVVGGRHIAIVKPTEFNRLYYDQRRFFSVVLMGVVNSNYEFLAADVDISVKISGQEHFFQTPFGKQIRQHAVNTDVWNREKNSIPYVFVGDSFQLNEHFMTPFLTDDVSENEQMYNYHINRVQRIADNTFGALFSKFGVLQKLIYLSPEKVKTIVLTCCYLYNFFRKRTEFHEWDGVFDTENFEDGEIVNGSWRDLMELTSLEIPVECDVSTKAKAVRERLAQYFGTI